MTQHFIYNETIKSKDLFSNNNYFYDFFLSKSCYNGNSKIVGENIENNSNEEMSRFALNQVNL